MIEMSDYHLIEEWNETRATFHRKRINLIQNEYRLVSEVEFTNDIVTTLDSNMGGYLDNKQRRFIKEVLEKMKQLIANELNPILEWDITGITDWDIEKSPRIHLEYMEGFEYL